MKSKNPPITYQEAAQSYFGGVKELVKQSLPFICTCGGDTFSF